MAESYKRVLEFWQATEGDAPAVPLYLWEVLADECLKMNGETVDADFERLRQEYHQACEEWNVGGRTEPQPQRLLIAEHKFSQLVCDLLHRSHRAALCFSGGGIRSATFGLGVLQGLARHSVPSDPQDKKLYLLNEFDYLSTVSGGGYLGAWFSSWAQRAGGADTVIRQLAAEPGSKVDPEPDPLLHLRRYSNYLNPRLGALSGDTWTMVATVVRNIFLNWLVLLPVFAAFLLLPVLFSDVLRFNPPGGVAAPIALVLGFVLSCWGMGYVIQDLPTGGDARGGSGGFFRGCLVPTALAGTGFALYCSWSGDALLSFSRWNFIAFACGIGIFGLVGAYLARWRGRPLDAVWAVKCLGCLLPTGVLSGLLLHETARGLHTASLFGLSKAETSAWLAFPAIMGVVAVSHSILVGLISRFTEDMDREWWSRAGGWVLLSGFAWFTLSGVVFLAAREMTWLWSAGGALLSGGIASRLGFSPKTKADADAGSGDAAGCNSLLRAVQPYALPLLLLAFVFALTVSLALANQQLARGLDGFHFYSLYASGSLLLFTALIVTSLVFSFFININQFSLHSMYRSRLIRAYLGASNDQRDPNPFTGFDPADNLHMNELRTRPLHVVNMALNLVQGKTLAWQQRKAESFTSTKWHTGSARIGYQPSKHYGHGSEPSSTQSLSATQPTGPEKQGITLGGAITISGAAANPNMGYHSSPLLGLVMTLFNARLGVWLANPGEPGRNIWDREGPTLSGLSLLNEALGRTNDTAPWVNLSDGGHFENLGLYEMVLRRCHTVVAVDASADPKFQYDDLANAVRKIRVDLGISIVFPEGMNIAHENNGGGHWAVGDILYGEVDACAEPGKLLYLKPALTGDEPRDVESYRRQCPDFPHQTTVDQWFDEAQFESYRQLGLHIVEDLARSDDAISLATFLQRAV